jgi:hypothetical protein
MKVPNSKFQTPKKLQIPSSNTQTGQRSLEFGAWGFSGAWCLGFGVSSHRQTSIAQGQYD